MEIPNLGQPQVGLDHLVHIQATVQLKEGQGTWSCIEPAGELTDRITVAKRHGHDWIGVDCLVRRPTGKGEVAHCWLDPTMVYVVIEADDYIDPIAGRAMEAS